MLLTFLVLFGGCEWKRDSSSSEKLNQSLPSYFSTDLYMYSWFLYPDRVPQPVIPYTKQEFKCLSDNIYHEARGEGAKGMRLVGHVTLNRALSSKYPSTLCKVVYQSKQFSWTANPSKIANTKTYKKARKAARDVLYRDKDESFGSLYFFGHKVVTPKWFYAKTVALKYKNHTFMR